MRVPEPAEKILNVLGVLTLLGGQETQEIGQEPDPIKLAEF